MAERTTAMQADLEWRADSGDVRADTRALQREIHEATQHMSNDMLAMSIAMEKRDKAMARHGATSTQAKQAELALRKATEQATASSKKHQTQVDAETRSLNRLARGTLAGSGVLQQLGRQIAFASSAFLGGAGLTYALVSTLRVAGEFQQQMSLLQAVTEATAGQMEAASRTAKDLGRDITLPATSAKDAAIAMTELGKGGLTVRDAMAAARGTLELAAAASIDAATAAKITVSALGAFGLQGKEASRVADQLAAAANAAQGEIPDMALALKQASAVAASFGLTTQETVTALTELARAGIIGSDAGTSLRVMLTYLIPKSKQAGETIAKYGLSVKDASGGFLTLREIIGRYTDALARLDPYQRQQVIRTIFGQDAQRAANIVLLRGVDAYDRFSRQVGKAGAAQELSAARTKGYLGALDAFKSSIETLQISVGEKLLPAFTEGARALTAWVNRVEESGRFARDLGQTVDLIGGGFVTLKNAIQPVNDALGGFQNTIALIFALSLAKKVTAFAASFGTISASAVATKVVVVREAAQMEAALDAATRPRVVSVTTTGGGVAAAGRFAGLGGPATLAATAILGSYFYNSAKNNASKAQWSRLSAKEQWAFLLEKTGGDQAKANELARWFESIGYEVKPPPPSAIGKPDEGTRGPRPGDGTRPGGGGAGTGGGGAPGRSQTDFELDLARATSDQQRVAILRRHLDYVNRAIKTLEEVNNKSKKQKERLLDLYDERDRTRDDIDSIFEEQRRKDEKARTERERKEIAAEKAFDRSSPELRGIRNRQLDAKGTKNLGDNIRFAQEEIEFWRDRKSKLDRTSGAYEHVVDELNKAKDRLRKLRARASLVVEQARLGAIDVEIPQRLRIAQLEAQLSGNEDAELKADKAVEAYLRRRLARAKKNSDLYEAILRELVTAQQAVLGHQGSSGDPAGELAALLFGERASFFASFAPNFFTQQQTPAGDTGRTPGTGFGHTGDVVINQNFPAAPTQDYQREAIYAARAYAARFISG